MSGGISSNSTLILAKLHQIPPFWKGMTCPIFGGLYFLSFGFIYDYNYYGLAWPIVKMDQSKNSN